MSIERVMSYNTAYTSMSSKYHRRLNIHDLPYELLSIIFIYATSTQPLEPWIATGLMSVCHRWASIITTIPRCWTNPFVDMHDMRLYSVSHLDFSLYWKYSRRHNMEICFDVRAPLSEENPAEEISSGVLARITQVGKSIRRSHARVRALRILSDSTECLRVCLESLTPKAKGYYPLLKDLYVEGADGTNVAARAITRLLSRKRQTRPPIPALPPNPLLNPLRCLVLYHVNLDWATLSIQELEELRIMYPPVIFDAQTTWKPPTLPQLRRILDTNATTLHSLELTNTVNDAHNLIAGQPVIGGTLHLPKLACLRLAFVHPGNLIRWVASTAIFTLEKLWVISLNPRWDGDTTFSTRLIAALTCGTWKFRKLKYFKLSGMVFNRSQDMWEVYRAAPAMFLVRAFRVLSAAEVISLDDPDDMTLNALNVAAFPINPLLPADGTTVLASGEAKAVLYDWFGNTKIVINSERIDALRIFVSYRQHWTKFLLSNNACPKLLTKASHRAGDRNDNGNENGRGSQNVEQERESNDPHANINFLLKNGIFKAANPNVNADEEDFKFGELIFPIGAYDPEQRFHQEALKVAKRVGYLGWPSVG